MSVTSPLGVRIETRGDAGVIVWIAVRRFSVTPRSSSARPMPLGVLRFERRGYLDAVGREIGPVEHSGKVASEDVGDAVGLQGAEDREGVEVAHFFDPLRCFSIRWRRSCGESIRAARRTSSSERSRGSRRRERS